MIKLKCLNCGLTLRRDGSGGDFCPRCLAREERIVDLINVSDEPCSPAPTGVERLTVRASSGGASRTIVLEGQLDGTSAPTFEGALTDMCGEGAAEIVVDMGGVEFVDSSGFNAILRAKALCERHNCALSLTPSQRPVQRVFQGTRLLHRLPFRKAGPEAHP
jgi:anti-sigma B factor antagonist